MSKGKSKGMQHVLRAHTAHFTTHGSIILIFASFGWVVDGRTHPILVGCIFASPTHFELWSTVTLEYRSDWNHQLAAFWITKRMIQLVGSRVQGIGLFFFWTTLNAKFVSPLGHRVVHKIWNHSTRTNPEFGQTQGEIFKKPAKKCISIHWRMKLRKPSILVINWVSLSLFPFFLSASTTATYIFAAPNCTTTIIRLEP
jgi:hypothetical protein